MIIVHTRKMVWRYTRSQAFMLVVLTVFLAFVSSMSFGQKSALDSLLRKFDAYRVASASEKIYVHVDQDVYLTGETIWLKMYLINATTHKPTDISKVVYVEVVDQFKHVVLQAKIPMRDGFGSGSLFIPASIDAGYYSVRAYTNWMKNSGPDFFFHKQVTIVNTFRKLQLEKNQPAVRPGLQFFPEGGNLVNGIRSKIAFKITNLRSLISAASCVVVSDQGDTLSTNRPDAMGIGSFYFTPQEGKEYKAVLRDSLGQQYTFRLPQGTATGFVLSVIDSTAEQIAVKITSAGQENLYQPVFLVAHARNMISHASVQNLKAGSSVALIPKKGLHEGITHITLFDNAMQPVCERLYFSPIARSLSIESQVSQREFGMRRKVSLDILAKDGKSNPVSANLSLAVYLADSIQLKDNHNMLNYIWLGSDLADVPELPADFLKDITREKQAILDNIMLTNGWRRFKWSSIVKDPPPVMTFIPEYRGHVINGKVTNPQGRAVRGVVTYLSAPGLNIQIYGSSSDALGDIKFEMKDFSGPRRIVVQTNYTKDSTSQIEILSPFSDKFATQKYPPFMLSKKLERQLTSRSVALQVQDIFYQDKGAISRGINVDTTAFYGKADATYYLDDYTRFPVMEEVMREYVPGVMVRKRKDGFHFFNIDVINKGLFDEDPFIMLDGIPIFDADKIMAFDPRKVKKLEVITRRYYTGVLSLPGVVSYTTYAGDLGGFELDPKSLVIDYEGLQLKREFYAPQYETTKQRESRLPDQRTLLYWAPAVVTGANGKQHLEFFTSDLTGNYHIVIEGITAHGAAGSGTATFVVRPFDN